MSELSLSDRVNNFENRWFPPGSLRKFGARILIAATFLSPPALYIGDHIAHTAGHQVSSDLQPTLQKAGQEMQTNVSANATDIKKQFSDVKTQVQDIVTTAHNADDVMEGLKQYFHEHGVELVTTPLSAHHHGKNVAQGPVHIP